MLGVGRLPPPSVPPLVLKKPTISSSLLFQHQTHIAKLPLLPESLSNFSSLSLTLSGRTGFCLFAQKKGEDSNLGVIKLEESEEFEEVEEEEDEFDFDDEFDEEDDDLDEDEDDDVIVPYDKVDDWLEKKPRGFGEGKVYDTSVEDKLLEEIEQSFKAQFANINKLKNKPKNPNPKDDPQEVLFNGIPGGIRVRINNLPKKRNIHRDLKSAFEGVPGIINISPVNSGNKKTRDPVCKGLAFVDFKSLADANSFVQMFSGRNVSFGKSEKPIKCEILKPLDGSYEGSSYDGYNSTSEGSILEEEEDEDDDVENNDTQLQLTEDDDYIYEEFIKGIIALDGKKILEDLDKSSVSERLEKIEMLESKLLKRASLIEEEMKESTKKSEVKNKSDKKPNQKTDKKPNVKPEKKPKLRVPGSAKKLKVREKAKLADALNRYGTRGASASKEK